MWTRGQYWTCRAFRQFFVRWIFIQRQLSDKLCSRVLCDNVFNSFNSLSLTTSQSKRTIFLQTVIDLTVVSLFIGLCQSIDNSLHIISVIIPLFNYFNKTLDQRLVSCLNHNCKYLLVLCNWQLSIHCSINAHSPLFLLASSCLHKPTVDWPLPMYC